MRCDLKFCKKCQKDTERHARGGCNDCVKIRTAAYRAANADRAKEYAVSYRSANREKMRECSAAWGKANKDKVNSANAAYRASNQEKRKANNAAWCMANPGARRIHNQNRRARKRANGGTLSRGLSAKLFKLQKGKCACCALPLGDDYHLDHIMPLALGGANKDSNIQLLRRRCNHQKNAKHPVDFMKSRGFLL